jgi:class 3 adenylate cyclase
MFITDKNDLWEIVNESFQKAKKGIKHYDVFLQWKPQQIISNNIPYYDICKLERGTYIEDFFVSFFADMRNSTERGVNIGIENVFLTIHAVAPTMIYIVEKYQGGIVDIPGDGIMALFKDCKNHNPSNKKCNSETMAVNAAIELLKAVKDIVNPLLIQHGIPSVDFGIGIDTGKVIISKIGTKRISDLKAIGTSIYNAAKHSKGNNEIFISKAVYEKIGDDIKILFHRWDEDWYCYKFQ